MDNLLFYFKDSREFESSTEKVTTDTAFGLQTVQLSLEIIVRLTDI